MSGALVQLAPAILGFLGGPAGGLAGAALQWLAGKFGASNSTVDAIKEAMNGMTADKQVELRKLDIEFQEFCMQQNIAIDLAQIDVNKVEAASTNWFVAGWRPFVGWVCGVGLSYVSIVEPMLRFLAQVVFDYKGAFPLIDTTLTMQVLLGMLGFGAMRMYEKKQGVAKD
jgi:hypothetical protein